MTDILDRLRRQVGPGARALGALLPALHGLVDRFDPGLLQGLEGLRVIPDGGEAGALQDGTMESIDDVRSSL